MTAKCPLCDATFKSNGSITEVMEAKRFHMEQRHLDAKIETDT